MDKQQSILQQVHFKTYQTIYNLINWKIHKTKGLKTTAWRAQNENTKIKKKIQK